MVMQITQITQIVVTLKSQKSQKIGHADLADLADFLGEHGLSHTEITERLRTRIARILCKQSKKNLEFALLITHAGPLMVRAYLNERATRRSG